MSNISEGSAPQLCSKLAAQFQSFARRDADGVRAVANCLTYGVLRLAASARRGKSWQDPPPAFLEAARRAVARGEAEGFTPKTGGREHQFDHMRAKEVKAALAAFSGPGHPLGCCTYGHPDGEHDVEVLGSLPSRIKRRLRKSRSWMEWGDTSARYRWRCSHDDDEAFWLRDADEMLDLVGERRVWLSGSCA